MKNENIVIAWWSAGITSAVAVKMAIELYQNVEIYYIKIDSAHTDNLRFKKDCEKWYGREIKEVRSSKYKTQFDVIEDRKAVNTPYGAPCTLELKKKVRYRLEDEFQITLFNSTGIANQVWGFEFDKKQVNRAIRFAQEYPGTYPLFPLIEKGLDKNACAGLLISAGIEIPAMYLLGFSNNNCIGCVKGGKWYWNQIRVHFPDVFNRMAKLERVVGHSCINGTFLDELLPSAGRKSKEIMPNCGLFCDTDFLDMPVKDLSSVMAGEKSIYDVIENINA